MMIVARSSPELNLKEACWQQLLFHEPCSKLRESVYFAQTRATSCQYLTSYPTMTNPQPASRQKAHAKGSCPVGQVVNRSPAQVVAALADLGTTAAVTDDAESAIEV